MRPSLPYPSRDRRRRAAAVALTGALALRALVAVPPAAADGPIADPGFETGTGWTVSGDAAAFSLKTDGSRSGDRNGSLWSAGAYDTSVSTAVTGLEPGWYTIRTWVRSGSAQPGQSLGATTVSTQGCGTDGTATAPSSEADDAWMQVAVPVEVTAGSDCRLVLRTQGVHGGEWARFDDITVTPGRVSRTVHGADMSGVEKNEALGAVYYGTDGTAGDPYALLAGAGVNLARLKVWVDPVDGYNTAEHVVAAARRAQAAGMAVMIDFHYSDTWADPGKQIIPAAWAGHSPEQLAQDVAEHTTEVLTALKNADVDVAYVQVGNEINPGMLLPYGQTWDVDPGDAVTTPQWDNLASFLSSGIAAVKDVYPQARTILHLTNINNGLGGLTWWFDEVMARGVDPDVLGLSFYGYWHGTLGDLQSVSTGLVDRYGKDVMVVETAYPFTLEDDSPAWENIITSPSQLIAGYPATPEGQAQWIHDVGTVVEALPGGHGLGVVAWEPAWTAVAGNGWDETDPSSGNAWENQAVFDFDGRLLATASAAFADDVLTPSTPAAPDPEPSGDPSPEPTAEPSSDPTAPATAGPGDEPTGEPSTGASSAPSATPSPSASASAAPSGAATALPTGSAAPAPEGGAAPSGSSLARTGAALLPAGALAALLAAAGTAVLRRRRRDGLS